MKANNRQFFGIMLLWFSVYMHQAVTVCRGAPYGEKSLTGPNETTEKNIFVLFSSVSFCICNRLNMTAVSVFCTLNAMLMYSLVLINLSKPVHDQFRLSV